MKKTARLLTTLILLLLPICLSAQTLENALNSAAGYFRKSGKVGGNRQILIRSVVNVHHNQQDALSTEIETQLYHAFIRYFPEVRLVDVKESFSGVSLAGTCILKGSYRKSGARVSLNLQIIDAASGAVLDQTAVDFQAEQRSAKLVAVLDIEAQSLNLEQRKILSDVFREALGETGAFNLASSADIDQMNPDEIQAATGCTRDSCATIIGEQLGVDRVISSSFRKLSENHYYITAKIIDIQDSSIQVTRSVKHDGELLSADEAIRELARRLAGESVQLKPVPPARPKPEVPSVPVAGSTTVDAVTTLEWQIDEPGKMPWREAVRYCFDLELAGKKDWRLPDKHELAAGHLISDRFPKLDRSGYYWSSTTNRNERDEAWGITARDGSLFDDGSKENSYYVRCVRGSRPPATESVVDERTGLEWQRGEGGQLNWDEAVKYCFSLKLAGKSDWRLPSIEELETAFDIQRSFPMLYLDGHYWSSTTTGNFRFMAWGMTVKSGQLFKDGMKFRGFNVRCVRGTFRPLSH